MFIFLFIFSIFPVINSQDKAEATPGDTPDNIVNLTMTVGKEAASVDLIPNNANGTFASSDTASGNNVTAEFTVSTTNYTGYNLQIEASDDDGLLVNSSANANLESITTATSEADFSADTAAAGTNYNGKWGYKPNVLNSAVNTNYQPSPTTTATILNNTNHNNGSDTTCTNPLNTTCATHKYTIAVGARADYEKPSGTYTNTYTLTAVANYVAYAIEYYDLTGISSSTANDSGITWTDPDTGSTAKKATFTSTPIATQASSITNTGISATVTLDASVITGRQTQGRNTYTFAGWCRKYDTTNGEQHNGIGVNQTITAVQNSSNKVTAYNNPATMCNGVVPDYNTTTDHYISASDPVLKIDPTLDNGASNPIKLYAVWKPTTFANAGIAANANMQTMTATICNNTTPNQFTTMRDSRDNGANTYVIIKLMDGNCWMADNLNFDAYTYKNNISTSTTHATGTVGSTAITRFKTTTATTTDRYATSAINSNSTYASSGNWTSSYSYSDPLINKSGKCDPSKNSSYQCLSPYQNANYTSATVINKYGTPASDSSGTANITYNFGPGGYKIGTYYNYCAATVGSYCYGNGTSYGTPSGNATEADICPAGWKLPVGGASGDFQNLYTKIGTITSSAATSTNPLSLQAMLSTPVSGVYHSGTAYRQGTYGYFWSSTYYSAYLMYHMFVSGTGVYPQDYSGRYGGSSVRCIVQR